MAIDFIAWHDRTLSNHTAKTDDSRARGYRFVSLTVYGDPSDPRYAAVMVKRAAIVEQQHWPALDKASWDAKGKEMAALGWWPAIVSATGTGHDPLFAVVFEQAPFAPVIQDRMTRAELQSRNSDAWAQGNILRWVDAYGTPDDVYYVAVWHPNTNRVSWNIDATDDDLPGLQTRFNNIVAGGGRPSHVAMTPAGRYLMLFEDSQVGTWDASTNLTSGGYQQKFNADVANGFAPLEVAAEGQGAGRRFSSIFVSTEQTAARTFRAQGPVANVGIDAAVEAYMKANRHRGAALAILDRHRLVYARGYTWAEPGYPDVLPSTLFRQASVSKTFTAVAIYQLLQAKRITLDTTMQSVLLLSTPAHGAPKDPRFGQVTIRQLLQFNSGIAPELVTQVVEATQAAGSPLPATLDQVAAYCASHCLDHTPGTFSMYNNTAYFLLGRIVARLRGQTNLIEALRPYLLAPLGMTRVRQSRSLVGRQAADEARYHPRPMKMPGSVMSPDRPPVLDCYGGFDVEILEGAGGLSAAVVDVARLLAALTLQHDSPILDQATRDSLFANATLGGHGFDGMILADPAQGFYTGGKGGLLNSSQNKFDLNTGGLSLVMCVNGNDETGVPWVEPVTEIATTQASQAWAGTDLFPQFGMPAFVV
jgi:CubicO group peptidase (beta-lactamase class C family)